MANATLLIANTANCLEDFFQRFPAEQAEQLMVSFTHANAQTVKEWREGRYSPKGEFLLRVRCLLDFVGYSVIEFDEIPAITRQFTRLIAFGLLSVEDARTALEYRNAKEVYALVLRGQSLKRDRLDKLQQAVDGNLVRLEEQTATWRQRIDAFKNTPADSKLTLGSVAISRILEVSTPEVAKVVQLVPGMVIAVPLLASILVAVDDLLEVLYEGSNPEIANRQLYEMVGNDRIQSLMTRLELLLG